MGLNILLIGFAIAFGFAITALTAGTALAQQTVQPLPKVDVCPLGWCSSGGYCIEGR
jgi:hypothetical protein